MPKFGEMRIVRKYIWLPMELPISTSTMYSWRWLTYEDVHQIYDDKFGLGWRDAAWTN